MRFLLQYPSEAQVSNIILVQLEEEEPSDFIRYQKFEPYMLNIMMKKEYEPAAPEQLHQAFRVLDPQLKGYIELDVMRELMLHKGIGFRDPQEIDPPVCGLAAVADSETGDTLLCDFNRAHQADYRAAFTEQRHHLKTELDAVGADLIELNTNSDCAETLTLYFRNRLRRAADETGG